MNRSIRQGLALAGLLCAAGASHAQSFYVGTFRPYFYSNNLYIEETSVQKGALPACATRSLLRLSADQSSSEFKAQYAILLAAWFSGRTVSIVGTGNCSPEGDEIVLSIAPQ